MVVGPAQWGTCIRTVSHEFGGPLAHWSSNIAIGGRYGDITILDALTGSQAAVLSGHMGCVNSLTYSSDGIFLVSGSNDTTVKLWDVQTGGVIKTLHGHTEQIQTVSISADNTMIASTIGDRFEDQSTYLWNIKTGNYRIMEDIGRNPIFLPNCIFSPTNSQLLLSSIHGNTQQWDINSHKIGSTVSGRCAAFSPDGTQFISQREKGITIRNTDSKKAIKRINLDGVPDHCCFSPNGRFIAVSVSHTIYLLDTAGPDPCPIQTFIGHSVDITSLVFSSPYCLISASHDKSIKFWQIDTSPADPGTPSTESTSLTSTPIMFVSLQARDGLAFSLDSAGVVKTWNILTGHCKESYKTQIESAKHADIQLINDRVIIVWTNSSKGKIYVWDARKGKLRSITTAGFIPATDSIQGLRVVRDGSRVLQLHDDTISAWDIWTGKFVCKASLKESCGKFDALQMDGSKVLVYFGESSVQGWDFGTPGSTPTQFSGIPSDRPHPNFIDARLWSGGPVRIEDSVTGKMIFQLYGRYTNPAGIQWDGQYLIAGYGTGEVLILDFSDFLAQ